MPSKARRDDLRGAIRAHGLRATPSRAAVLQILEERDQPISHGDVAKQLASRGWDPATVYRNLMDFVEAGLARRIDVGDHVWRFQLVRDDHEAAAHPHFVCTTCGVVECLPELELELPRTKLPRALRKGAVEVHVRGLCDSCIGR